MDTDKRDRIYERGERIMEIKIPKFEGDEASMRRELRAFARQVVEVIQNLQATVDALAESMEG